jgi:hypothetical protein
VVSNFARRLDKIERQLRERLNENLGPVYLREGTTIPEGIAPERVIFIERVIVEPPEHPEEPAPIIPEARSEANGHDRAAQYPSLGLV